MQRGQSNPSVFKVPILLSALGLLAPGCLVGDGEIDAPTWNAQELGKGAPAHDEKSILIKFRDTPSATAMQEVLSRVGGKIQDANGDGKDDRFANIAKGRLAKIDLDGSLKVFDAISRLKNHPAIEYVEPNYIVHLIQTPNDPSFGNLWGLQNLGQTGGTAGADISALDAWDTSVGNHEVIIGVIDTGIDYTHPDLAANMWVNPGEIPGNGIDDDGNGYIDDVYGINAITGSGDPMDDHDHGTHVAGTIGAVGDNGTGVVGVNWNVSMVGLKFLSGSGSGTTADAIACIDYAVDLKLNRGVNIRALNNSWGGGGFSQALEDSIRAASDADILFLAAAGNSAVNNDNSPHYPSNYDVPNVVSVASTDHNDNMSSFSNYGATTVHLGAPGSAILSTVVGGGYATFSGTSMATPHVTGAAALLLSVNDTLTVEELKDLLMTYGDPIASLAGKTISGNRLNVANSLAQVSPPGPSFRLAASPASQTVNQGDSASYTIDVSSVAGFADDVALSLDATPALNAAVSFTPNPVAADSSATLSIATTTATAAGTYSLTVTGTAGEITKSRTLSLTVYPEGTIVNTYSNDTPVSIPDNNPAGVTSELDVPDSLLIAELAVEVNITHTYIGDLIVRLSSPEGTTVTLHNRSGGSADNIYQTYTPAELQGEDSFGTWTLFVSDNAGSDIGTLDSWSLIVTGTPTGSPGNHRPTADFSAISDGLTATFTDTSTDTDGTIVAWSWSFGDGNTSSEQHPVHTYAEAGTYTVSLTVTDDGGRTDSASQSVKVLPDGAVFRSYSNTTQVGIPDNTPSGIESTIEVPEGLAISELEVELRITHTYIGDLIVRLSSPEGTTVTLHNRSGGSADNIYQTFAPVEFNDQNAVGTWTLFVSDNAGADIGTLDRWTLNLTGVLEDGGPVNSPPAADFTASVSDLTASFTDASTDADGSIVAWSWSFGDGNGSSAQHPVHTYAAAGTYTVSLTVTDDAGASDTFSQSVTVTEPVSVIELGIAETARQGNRKLVTLSWSGAATASVEIYRNGSLVTLTANTGSFTDDFRNGASTFVYVVCETEGGACSNEATASF